MQATTPHDAHAAGSTASWSPFAAHLLGERAAVGATSLWARTVTDYADGLLTAEQVDRRVHSCLTLDPDFTQPARLGALMVSTLPVPDVAVHRRILQRGANTDSTDSWFPRAMVVSLAQDPAVPADLALSWQHRANAAEASWK
ncbi:MAG: hypothetical protein ACJATT_000384 [Myxococcota bacterium]